MAIAKKMISLRTMLYVAEFAHYSFSEVPIMRAIMLVLTLVLGVSSCQMPGSHPYDNEPDALLQNQFHDGQLIGAIRSLLDLPA